MTTLAVGPCLPTFGSWNWIAGDILKGFSSKWTVISFDDPDNPPAADIVLFLKFKPLAPRLTELRKHALLVYMPVDVYGSCAEIEADCRSLQSMDVILVHCARLLRYFSVYSRTEYVDHALRYITTEPVTPAPDGPLLWIGKEGNIGPFVEWCNQQTLGRPVRVLTDQWNEARSFTELGFNYRNAIEVSLWTAERHVASLATAALAVDIKGHDFRSRHKPPAKVLDFLASGLPALINKGSSADLHLSGLGISPFYVSDWPACFGRRGSDRQQLDAAFLRTILNREAVLQRFVEILNAEFSLRRIRS